MPRVGEFFFDKTSANMVNNSQISFIYWDKFKYHFNWINLINYSYFFVE